MRHHNRARAAANRGRAGRATREDARFSPLESGEHGELTSVGDPWTQPVTKLAMGQEMGDESESKRARGDKD
jgi:hypothetical protein